MNTKLQMLNAAARHGRFCALGGTTSERRRAITQLKRLAAATGKTVEALCAEIGAEWRDAN